MTTRILERIFIATTCVSVLLPVSCIAATSTEETIPTQTPVSSAAIVRDTENGRYERAIIQGTKTVSQNADSGARQQITYTIEFLSGPEKGTTQTLSNDVSSNPYGLSPLPGDKVLIFIQPDPNGGPPLAYLEGYDRRAALYWLIALFAFTMVLLAGWQGVKVVFSIGLSIFLIGAVLIPGFLKGLNPIPIAFGLIAVLITISSCLSVGWNKKALATIVGTMGGVVVAYIISVIFANWAHLNGLSTEEDRLFFDKNPNLNPTGLLFAGIAIAAMGVVEDVAVSIASGVMEVRRANIQLGFKELFRSGMIIGRDHMSALANTLVFAYVGGSLSTLLLYTQFGGSWAKFINFDSIADEVIRSLAGTIGLVFTVPITALLAAWIALYIKKQNTDREPNQYHSHTH